MTDGPARITAPFLDVIEVLLDGGELHGWAIIKASKRGGPTVYKILERLEEMRWVSARWDDQPVDPNKPRRRYYALTGNGASRARALLAERRPATTLGKARQALGGGLA